MGRLRAYEDRGFARQGILSAGQPEAAVDHFKNALAAQPEFIASYVNLCDALKRLGDWDQAKIFADMTVALADYSPRFSCNLRQVYRAVCDFEGLEKLGDVWEDCEHTKTGDLPAVFLDLLVYAEDAGSIRNLRDLVVRWARDVEKQDADVARDIVEVCSEDANVLGNVGGALFQFGMLKEAKAILSRAVELDPTIAIASNNLGSMLLSAGQPEAAVDHFKNALAAQPEFIASYVNLCDALKRLGDWDQAKIFADMTVALADYSPRFSCNLRQVYRAVCDFEGLEKLGDVWEDCEHTKTGDLPAKAFFRPASPKLPSTTSRMPWRPSPNLSHPMSIFATPSSDWATGIRRRFSPT